MGKFCILTFRLIHHRTSKKSVNIEIIKLVFWYASIFHKFYLISNNFDLCSLKSYTLGHGWVLRKKKISEL